MCCFRGCRTTEYPHKGKKLVKMDQMLVKMNETLPILKGFKIHIISAKQIHIIPAGNKKIESKQKFVKFTQIWTLLL